MSSNPFSIRLNDETDQLVRAIALREGRSRSAVVGDLLSESAKMRMFPGVGFKGNAQERRAYVIGAYIDVWQVVELVDVCGDVDAVTRDFDLTEHQVRLSLAYYDAFPDEIDSRIKASRVGIEEVRRTYPGLVIDEVKI